MESEMQKIETRQLQVENKYLKLILDDLHKSIIVGEATLQMELKPPEDIKNDKLLMELTTNTRKIKLKFYELETELDYIHRTISQLTSMIVGDDSSKDPTQEKTNKFTATGRQPKHNPARKFEQREQSSKIDKDIELVTSVWRNLKEKEMKTNEVENLEYFNQCLDGLLQYLHDHVVSGAETSPRTIAQLAEIKPESSIALRYQHAQDICAQYTKVENGIKELQEKSLVQGILMAYLDDYVTTKKPNISLDIPNDIQMDPRFGLEYGQATRIAQEFEKKERELSESNQEMQEMANKIKEYKQKRPERPERAYPTDHRDKRRPERPKSAIPTDHRGKGLSKIASDRLTHENTDITDLSDEIRPSKLTEKMSELYDNQWTSAFDEMKTNGFEDENAIGILLKIVMETNQMCKAMAFSHYQKLKEACTCFEYSIADEENKEKGEIVTTDNISIEMKQDIKRIWCESSKKVLKKVIPIIGRKVAGKFDIPLLQMKQTPLYMKECAELCWMMNIQEKPMHLDISVPEKDGHKYFDTEKFRSYTKTGQHVAFVVWPALYLFEGGSLLKKGVAEGLKVKKGTSGQEHSSVPRP